MAVHCKDCDGIIPDVIFSGGDRNDCKNHTKREINVDLIK